VSTEDFTSSLDDLEPPSGPTERSVPAFDFRRMLALRLPAMIAVAVVLAAVSLPTVWRVVPTRYTAEAEIRFISRTPRVLYAEEGMSAPYNMFVSTQLQMITGNTILSRVLENEAIRDLPELREVENPLAFLRGCVSASVNRSSELVTVSCTLEERDSALAILEEVISVYLEYAAQEENSDVVDRLEALERERDSRQAELQRQLTDLAAFEASPYVTIDPTEESSLYLEGLLLAERDIERANRQIEEIEEELARLDALRASGETIYDYEVHRMTEADGRVATLQMKELQLTQALDGLVEGSPQRTSIEKELRSTQSTLASVRAAVQSDVLNGIRRQFELERDRALKDLTAAEEEQAKFQALMDEQRERIASAVSEQNRYEEMLTNVEKTRSLLDEVRRKITEIEVEQNAPARVRLASPASAPPRPDYGRRYRFMFVALVASMAAGYGYGMLRELTDQQIRSGRDLGRVTRLPVLATVPDASEDPALKGAYLPFVMADHPNTTSAEEFRRVLAYLLYTSEEASGASSVLIASPSRGDGKTTLVCNLGIALAASNHRTLIVETGSRRADIEQCFRLDRAPGLSELLAGGGTAADYIRETVFEGLFVLGPGLDSDRLAGALASPELLQFLSAVEGEFDQVLFDTPPSLMVSDARLLAPVVDSVIVVTGSGVSTLGLVRRCIRDLEHGNARMLGIVLNRVQRIRGGYMASSLRMHRLYGRPHATTGAPLPEMAVMGDATRTTGRRASVPEMQIVDDEDDPDDAAVAFPIGDEESRPSGRSSD